ncbi:hypothetical protein B296_00024199 [Ensete ventricosum]|uniref:THH1/TOM1/TOM3 domain-containing protein n=1 Tax=Ensete ventricosum TaxID=4639 RepID=A0A426Z5B0_ENSVE|nr:hypothetical protein B296_00024199 [Ensete ventricosum]
MFVIHRLFLMLKRFPVESKGRLKKLQEVSMNFSTLQLSTYLPILIAFSFVPLHRLAMLRPYVSYVSYVYVCGSHSVTSGFFFCFLQFVEILPSALVLFILRKLPPKRGITQYHPIH